MVQDTLSAQDLQDLEPVELLEEALQDDRVLRLVEDAVRIGRAHASDWIGTVDGDDVANLVRFHYDPDIFPESPFRQLHVRLFADGTLEAYEEPSALMHKGPHIREETFNREVGTAAVRTILEDAGVDIEVLEEAR